MKLGLWQGLALEGARDGGMAGTGKTSLEVQPSQRSGPRSPTTLYAISELGERRWFRRQGGCGRWAKWGSSRNSQRG